MREGNETFVYKKGKEGSGRFPPLTKSTRVSSDQNSMKKLRINTSKRTQFIDITGRINNLIKEMGRVEGVVELFVPHTTAGITINEKADPSVVSDMATILDRLVPREGNYSHLEGNSAAHMKSSLLGHSVRVFVEGGNLCLGTWQAVFFCEFDGPRTRQVWLRFEVE